MGFELSGWPTIAFGAAITVLAPVIGLCLWMGLVRVKLLNVRVTTSDGLWVLQPLGEIVALTFGVGVGGGLLITLGFGLIQVNLAMSIGAGVVLVLVLLEALLGIEPGEGLLSSLSLSM